MVQQEAPCIFSRPWQARVWEGGGWVSRGTWKWSVPSLCDGSVVATVENDWLAPALTKDTMGHSPQLPGSSFYHGINLISAFHSTAPPETAPLNGVTIWEEISYWTNRSVWRPLRRPGWQRKGGSTRLDFYCERKLVSWDIGDWKQSRRSSAMCRIVKLAIARLGLRDAVSAEAAQHTRKPSVISGSNKSFVQILGIQ